MTNAPVNNDKALSIVVFSGDLDKALAAFFISTAAASMGYRVTLFFTFWGLNALVKGGLEKAGLPVDYKQMEEPMRKKLKEMKYPTPYDMLKRMKASGLLKIYACSPTMEMFGIKKENLIPEVDQIAGASAFLDIASDADVTLLV